MYLAKLIENKEEIEKVILVAVSLDDSNDADESLDELEELVNTAGAQVVGRTIQNREAVHPGTYVGKGKVEELKDLIWETQATAIVCDDELTPAQYKNPDKNELFLVEGDSAGGTAKQGRDRSFQAILPLRGKVINTAKAKIEEVLKNEEIMSIINAIGGGFGPDFDVTKSNYSKVIIMTDADTDGAHIQILLLTFFYRYMKQLVEKGMVYIATPPLYKITSKNGIEYAWTDEELREKIQKKNVQIQRYKGLGEMNDEQLWETTMDPTKRTLIQVLIGEDGDAENKMEILMGDDVEPRREWIENNVVFDNDDNFILEDVSEDE